MKICRIKRCPDHNWKTFDQSSAQSDVTWTNNSVSLPGCVLIEIYFPWTSTYWNSLLPANIFSADINLSLITLNVNSVNDINLEKSWKGHESVMKKKKKLIDSMPNIDEFDKKRTTKQMYNSVDK